MTCRSINYSTNNKHFLKLLCRFLVEEGLGANLFMSSTIQVVVCFPQVASEAKSKHHNGLLRDFERGCWCQFHKLLIYSDPHDITITTVVVHREQGQEEKKISQRGCSCVEESGSLM